MEIEPSESFLKIKAERTKRRSILAQYRRLGGFRGPIDYRKTHLRSFNPKLFGDDWDKIEPWRGLANFPNGPPELQLPRIVHIL